LIEEVTMYEPRRIHLTVAQIRAIQSGDRPEYDELEALCTMGLDLIALRDELEVLLADYAPYVKTSPPSTPPTPASDPDATVPHG
jgi:hypothetical protein